MVEICKYKLLFSFIVWVLEVVMGEFIKLVVFGLCFDKGVEELEMKFEFFLLVVVSFV